MYGAEARDFGTKKSTGKESVIWHLSAFGPVFSRAAYYCARRFAPRPAEITATSLEALELGRASGVSGEFLGSTWRVHREYLEYLEYLEYEGVPTERALVHTPYVYIYTEYGIRIRAQSMR